MKIQNTNISDKKSTGSNPYFRKVDYNPFFVNLTCVLAESQILKIGKSYLYLIIHMVQRFTLVLLY